MTTHILYPRSSQEPTFALSEFLREPIGKGSYGTVFKAVHLTTLKLFAIKEIRKKGNESTIHHQLTTMYKLNHCHVVRLYDHFEDEFNVYLMMEFVEGQQLYQSVIAPKITLNNREIALILHQLCLAANHIHEAGVIHRDIKPENIMISKKNRKVKLADFGASFEESDTRKTTIGTPQYTAPEIVKGRKHTKAVDIWAIGVVLFQLTTMKLPFDSKTTLGVYENIKSGKYEFPECIREQEELKDLIKNILILKPDKRYTANDILNHPWLRKNIDSKNPSTIKIVSDQTHESNMNDIMVLKEKIFQLQLQISKVKSPEKNKEKKLRGELEMKIAVMQGKVKTVHSLTEAKEKRIKILDSQIEDSQREEEEIQGIKREHQKIRELIEEGNKSYLEHVKERRRLEGDNVSAQQQLTQLKTIKRAKSPLPSTSPTHTVKKNTPSDRMTTNTSLKSIDLTESCNSLMSVRPLSCSQGIEGFFLWLNERKRVGLGSKYSQ